MEFTNEQIEKARNCKTLEEFKSLAKAEGLVLSEDDAKTYFESTRTGELSDDDLAAVAGGKGDWVVTSEKIVYINCPFCGTHLKIKFKWLKHKKTGERSCTFRPNECTGSGCDAWIAYDMYGNHFFFSNKKGEGRYVPMPK